jgi:hypothetical protein
LPSLYGGSHPQTGRKAIFLGDRTETVEGMDCDEGRSLIAEINLMITPQVFTATNGLRASVSCGTTAVRCTVPPDSMRRA